MKEVKLDLKMRISKVVSRKVNESVSELQIIDDLGVIVGSISVPNSDSVPQTV